MSIGPWKKGRAEDAYKRPEKKKPAKKKKKRATRCDKGVPKKKTVIDPDKVIMPTATTTSTYAMPALPADLEVAQLDEFPENLTDNKRIRPDDISRTKSLKNVGSVRDIRILSRQYTTKAFRRVLELMASPNDRVAIIACQEILNRGWGRPQQAVAMDEDGVARATIVVTGVIRGPSDSY